MADEVVSAAKDASADKQPKRRPCCCPCYCRLRYLQPCYSQPNYLKGVAYIKPPVVQSPLRPRSSFKGLDLPTLRSKISP